MTRRLPTATTSALPEHPVRVALLDLLAREGSVTSTEAARELGYSSGLCSFHLRQLARHGLIEEAPTEGGRARPWQLRWGTVEPPGSATPGQLAKPRRGGTGTGTGAGKGAGTGGGMSATGLPNRAQAGAPAWGPVAGDGVSRTPLSRELEDASHQHWLSHRSGAPQEWQADEAFSTVLHLTPSELADAAAAIRAVLAGYQQLDPRRPDAQPVAAISRLFPLLPTEQPQEHADPDD